MAESVWVVVGFTGEYSDSEDWMVGASLTEAGAKELCERLESWCRENGCGWADRASIPYDRRPPACPLDPQFRCDSTGTGYEVWPVPLV